MRFERECDRKMSDLDARRAAHRRCAVCIERGALLRAADTAAVAWLFILATVRWTAWRVSAAQA
jgi:hypothetical protein